MMHRRSPVSFAAIVALSLALAACKRGAPAPAAPPRSILGAVSVSDLTPRDKAPAQLDTDAIERVLRARLVATGLFEREADAGAPPPGKGVTRVQVHVGIDGAEVESKGLARARAAMRLETRPSSAPGAFAEDLDGVGEETYAVPTRPGQHGHQKTGDAAAPSRETIFGALVLRVAGDLVDEMAARRRLAVGTPEAVASALRADGGPLRLEAIRIAGERKLTSEGPALIALLNDPDETTRDAALGALIRLGDRKAVTELTRTRSLRDEREMRKIIEAISMLGGEEADDYLSFVASSHDDEDIRAQAAAARARLEKRRADGAANPR
jgi:hypothetical protein